MRINIAVTISARDKTVRQLILGKKFEQVTDVRQKNSNGFQLNPTKYSLVN